MSFLKPLFLYLVNMLRPGLKYKVYEYVRSILVNNGV